MGRSTLLQNLISWFSWAGIPFSAIDADSEHKTLSEWYPEETTFYPYHVEDDLLPLLNEAGSAPVEIIDFPAQATESILAAMTRFGAAKIFAEKGIRPTICIFASGEKAALYSAAQIHSQLRDEADYLIITNPARIDKEYQNIFFGSKLARELQGCPQLEIPRITGNTLKALSELNKTRKETLTFRNAEPLLKHGNRNELEYLRAQKLWAGTVVVHPNAKTGPHHHGELETVIYIVRGRARFRWGEQLELVDEAGPGDFVYVPPFAPHQELNARKDQPVEAVIVRSGQEPVVVNLDIPSPEDENDELGSDPFHSNAS